MTRPIQIGLLGVGTVGGGVATLLSRKSAAIAAETGRGIELRRAIAAGKHVVTANKDLMAMHGVEILRAAAERGVDVYYEASVGGGIPLIGVFRQDLVANEVR